MWHSGGDISVVLEAGTLPIAASGRGDRELCRDVPDMARIGRQGGPGEGQVGWGGGGWRSLSASHPDEVVEGGVGAPGRGWQSVGPVRLSVWRCRAWRGSAGKGVGGGLEWGEWVCGGTPGGALRGRYLCGPWDWRDAGRLYA